MQNFHPLHKQQIGNVSMYSFFFSRTRRRAAYQYIKKNKGEKSPKELHSQLLQEKETSLTKQTRPVSPR